MREDHPDAVKVVVRVSDGSNSKESADIQTGEPIHRFSFPYVSAAHVPICPRRDKHGTVRCGAAGAAPHNRVTGIDFGLWLREMPRRYGCDSHVPADCRKDLKRFR